MEIVGFLIKCQNLKIYLISQKLDKNILILINLSYVTP